MRKGNLQQLTDWVSANISSQVHGHLDMVNKGAVRTKKEIKYSIQQGFGYQVDLFVKRSCVSDRALAEFQARWGSDCILDFNTHDDYLSFLRRQGLPARKRGDIPHFQEHVHANEQKFRFVGNLIRSYGKASLTQFTSSELQAIAGKVTTEMWDGCLVAWVTRAEEKVLGQSFRGPNLQSSLSWYQAKGVGLVERDPGGAHARIV